MVCEKYCDSKGMYRGTRTRLISDLRVYPFRGRGRWDGEGDPAEGAECLQTERRSKLQKHRGGWEISTGRDRERSLVISAGNGTAGAEAKTATRMRGFWKHTLQPMVATEGVRVPSWDYSSLRELAL